MNPITIVITCRKEEDAAVTLNSLAEQTFRGFDIVVVKDMDRKGANWARNRGAEKIMTPFILFSDDDIQWEPDALEVLYNTLLAHPEAAYSYGSYDLEGWVQCDVPFDAERLRKANFISTMSLVRTECFPGWDESIQRLQDWDLWLTMLENGREGVYCGRQIFKTTKRGGITYGDCISYEDAKAIVKEKHGL